MKSFLSPIWKVFFRRKRNFFKHVSSRHLPKGWYKFCSSWLHWKCLKPAWTQKRDGRPDEKRRAPIIFFILKENGILSSAPQEDTYPKVDTKFGWAGFIGSTWNLRGHKILRDRQPAEKLSAPHKKFSFERKRNFIKRASRRHIPKGWYKVSLSWLRWKYLKPARTQNFAWRTAGRKTKCPQ